MGLPELNFIHLVADTPSVLVPLEASLSDNVTIRLGKPHSKRKSFHLVSVDGRAASLASSDLPTTNPGEDADRPHTPGQSEVEMEAEEQRREARESQEQGATSRSSSGGRDWSEQRRRIKEAARQDALKRLGIQGA